MAKLPLASAAYADRWLSEALAFGTPEGGSEGGDAGALGELSEDASGWRLAHGGRSVAYSPVQHRDPVFEPLMNALLAAGLGGSGDPPAQASGSGMWADDLGPERTRLAERAFEQFTSTEAPAGSLASCLKCHGSGTENPAASVRWTAAGRDPMRIGFTRFDHGSHLTLLGQEESCARCHQLAEESSGSDTEAMPADSFHGFQPHRKEQCSSCHRPGRASQDCLTCHRYHWNRP
jgi:cytochrome c553